MNRIVCYQHPCMLTDIIKIDGTSGVTLFVEEACLHILKKQSDENVQTCQLVLGGPRPTLVSITLVTHKPSIEHLKKHLEKEL